MIFIAGASGLAAIGAAAPAPAEAAAQRVIPNDLFFKYQISFLNPGGKIQVEGTSTKPSPVTLEAQTGFDTDITRAWTISTGSRNVMVAVLDDGFFYNHEDLAGNIWKNQGESGPGSRLSSNEALHGNTIFGKDMFLSRPSPDIGGRLIRCTLPVVSCMSPSSEIGLPHRHAHSDGLKHGHSGTNPESASKVQVGLG
jgi:hypothetical protein